MRNNGMWVAGAAGLTVVWLVILTAAAIGVATGLVAVTVDGRFLLFMLRAAGGVLLAAWVVVLVRLRRLRG